MGSECPICGKSNRFGGNAAPPIGGTNPIADLGTPPIDVGHRLKPHAADCTTIDTYCQGKRRIDGRPTNVGLSVGHMIRMREQVAQLDPNATVICHGRNRFGVAHDE